MIVIGVDVETTGLTIGKDRIIEVGAVAWDTERNVPAFIFSKFVYEPLTYPDLSPEITALTGIHLDNLTMFGESPKEVFQELATLMRLGVAVVAHNGNQFDKPMIAAEFQREGVELPQLPWIDTLTDVPYPPKIETRKLPYLAAEHGFLNPFSHRAVFDVLTMFEFVKQYDFQQILALSAEPSVLLQAHTQAPWLDGGASNTIAKGRGFRWDGSRKLWCKTVKRSQAAAELAKADLPVSVVDTVAS